MDKASCICADPKPQALHEVARVQCKVQTCGTRLTIRCVTLAMQAAGCMCTGPVNHIVCIVGRRLTLIARPASMPASSCSRVLLPPPGGPITNVNLPCTQMVKDHLSA